VVDVDPFGVDAERLQAFALDGQVLFDGGDSAYPIKRPDIAPVSGIGDHAPAAAPAGRNPSSARPRRSSRVSMVLLLRAVPARADQECRPGEG